MQVHVRLFGRNDAAVTVPFVTADGTAVAGKDYVRTHGKLVIRPGTTGGAIKVPIIGDTKREPNHRFEIRLGRPTNAVKIDSSASGTILNDDR